jgi:serine phosphatase RsbU (regulator of sigma subunit)
MDIHLTESQLYTLLDSMRLINSTLDLDELLAIIMKEVTENLDADRSTLYLVDEQKNEIWSKIAQGDSKLIIRQPIGKGISGYVAKSGEILNIEDAYQDSRFNPQVDKKSGYRTRSILCMPVRDKNGKIIAVLQVLNKKSGRFTREDEAFTLAFTDFISMAIQNAQLYQEALERKRLENEIAIAGEIQKMLLPSKLPDINNYELYAYQHPSRHIGGDYYDFFRDTGHLHIILADVSGKGTPAALLMANMQATVHNLLGKINANKELISQINSHLFAFSTPDKYATLVWGELELNSNQFNYITAGHIPPIQFSRKENQIQITDLPNSSIPVGLIPEFDFEENTTYFKTQDIILICSDGITEAHNKKNEMFEIPRLKKIVKRNFDKSLKEIGDEIISQVKGFAKDGLYEDDVTLVMLRRLK